MLNIRKVIDGLGPAKCMLIKVPVQMKKKRRENDDSWEENEYEDFDYGKCDNCGQLASLKPCPAREYEVKHGITTEAQICSDCCEYDFGQDPWSCLSYAEEGCPRVKEIQLDFLDKLAKERNWKKSSEQEHTYINPSKTVAVGSWDSPPQKMFEEDARIPTEILKGVEYSLAKDGKTKFAYSNELVDETLAVLKKLGEEDLEYEVLRKKGFLVINGYLLWAVVAGNISPDWAYSTEKENFVVQTKKGYEFFIEDVKDELYVTEISSTVFDWGSLDQTKFEELCRDVLEKHSSFQDCLLTSGPGDEGRDIKASERIVTFTGTELRKWCIQCKHFLSRPVSRSDIDDLNNLHVRFKFDVFCLMTSNFFSPGAIRLLEEYEKQAKYKVKYMDRQFLEGKLKGFRELIGKYFAK